MLAMGRQENQQAADHPVVAAHSMSRVESPRCTCEALVRRRVDANADVSSCSRVCSRGPMLFRDHPRAPRCVASTLR